MGCNDCSIAKSAIDTISVAAHETEMRRGEKRNTRLCVIIVILIIALVLSNVLWLRFLSQYDFETETYDYTQDGKGVNIIGDDNEVDQHGTETDNTP